MKELLFVKINDCSETEKTELFRIAQVFDIKVIDYNQDTVLLECVQNESKNDDLITLLEKNYSNKIELVRSGSVAIESVSITNK